MRTNSAGASAKGFLGNFPKLVGMLKNDSLVGKTLMDISVPTRRALISGLEETTIDSINSVIQAAQSVIHNRCVMVGDYPSFLIKESFTFPYVCFIFIVKQQIDFYSFYINFAKLIEEHLNPDIDWQFNVYHDQKNNYKVTINYIPLTEKSSISFFSGGSSDLHTVELKANDVEVAKFCFFVKKMANSMELTLINKEMVCDSLIPVEEFVDYIDRFPLLTLIRYAAFFNGHNGGLYLCRKKNNISVLKKVPRSKQRKIKRDDSEKYEYLVKKIRKLSL